jgi:hypothetical protein
VRSLRTVSNDQLIAMRTRIRTVAKCPVSARVRSVNHEGEMVPWGSGKAANASGRASTAEEAWATASPSTHPHRARSDGERVAEIETTIFSSVGWKTGRSIRGSIDICGRIGTVSKDPHAGTARCPAGADRGRGDRRRLPACAQHGAKPPWDAQNPSFGNFAHSTS